MKRIFLIVSLALISLLSFAQLPSVSLRTIDGKTVNTAKLNNNGKPFIISFFATWCKPCQQELDAINEVIADWAGRSLWIPGLTAETISFPILREPMKLLLLVNGGTKAEIFLFISISTMAGRYSQPHGIRLTSLALQTCQLVQKSVLLLRRQSQAIHF